MHPHENNVMVQKYREQRRPGFLLLSEELYRETCGDGEPT